MEKKTGCDWSGTEKKGGVHLGGVVKQLAGDLFSNDILTQVCVLGGRPLGSGGGGGGGEERET